jgi:hypothetical protein
MAEVSTENSAASSGNRTTSTFVKRRHGELNLWMREARMGEAVIVVCGRVRFRTIESSPHGEAREKRVETCAILAPVGEEYDDRHHLTASIAHLTRERRRVQVFDVLVAFVLGRSDGDEKGCARVSAYHRDRACVWARRAIRPANTAKYVIISLLSAKYMSTARPALPNISSLSTISVAVTALRAFETMATTTRMMISASYARVAAHVSTH